MAVTGFQLKEKPVVMLETVIYPMLKKYDPSEKYGLCQDIKNSVLRIIREANYYCYDSSNRRMRLDAIDMELAAIRMQVNISMERRQITGNKKLQVFEWLDEIGCIVGGIKHQRASPDDTEFSKAVDEALRENFIKALVNFPAAEKGSLTRAILNEFYSIARFYKGYRVSDDKRYLQKVDAALCTILEYVQIARTLRYVSRKQTYKMQGSIRALGVMCGELRTK